MKRWIRIGLVGVAGLALVAAMAVAAATWRGGQRLTQTLRPPVSRLQIPADAAALARGRYLYAAIGCAGCHQADGAGRVLWDGGLTVLRSPQIAPGRGSAVTGYQGEDWVRAVRHGVGRNATALLSMPSVDYQHLSDADLGAVAAYVGTLPPLDQAPRRHDISWRFRALIGAGVVPLAPDLLVPGVQPAAAQAPAVTEAWGRYLAQTCVGCHGERLSGGKIPGLPPGTPPAANLTAAADGAMSRYPTLAQFQAMLKSGRRPDGSKVAVMPFESLSRLDDTDTAALYLHLKSLPARAAGAD